MHKQASQDLLREVYNNKQVKLGTEFSIVYDENMQRIPGHGYRIGKVGSVRIDNPNVKYHAFHNHGSDESFSYGDLYFAYYENMLSLTDTGNAGSKYVIVKTPKSDTDGYITFLDGKAHDIIYSANGLNYTLGIINSMNTGKISIAPLKKLTDDQLKELKLAIKKATDACTRESKKYGIKYIYQKAGLANG